MKHRLLKRQLKKSNIDTETIAKIEPLLDLVAQSYVNFDKDIYFLENVLELSSQELFRANKQLSKDVETKQLEVDNAYLQIQNIVESIQEVIFQIDLEGNWKFLNSAWERMFGLSKEETIGTNFRDLLSYMDETSVDVLKQIETIPEGGYRQTLFINLEDRSLWIDLSVQKTFDFQNEHIGYIGSIIDITELKEIEGKLINANKTKDEFLSTMSHEIRTPLNAVVGLSNLLKLNVHLPEQDKKITALNFSAQHLLSLINDILDFNKINAGKLELDKEEFSLKELLNGINDSFGVAAKEKGISLGMKYALNIPELLLGDRMRMNQVLSNLVSNAIKFTHEGKVIVDVDVLEQTKDRVKLKITVEDTGIGIPEDKISSIFDTFTQVHKNRNSQYGGTGLGLSISKKILELHDSELLVESTIEEGTCFHFEIEFDVSDRKIAHVDSSTNSIENDQLDDLYVLLAEDNKINVLVIEQFFKKWGIKMDVAENGREAIEMLKKNQYDLVLMDIQMPEMDGLEATRLIRESKDPSYNQVPIIALTASALKEDLDRTTRAGMNDYLRKPFDPRDLFNKLAVYSNR